VKEYLFKLEIVYEKKYLNEVSDEYLLVE